MWISRVDGISRFFAAEGIAIVIFEKSNLGSGEPPFFGGRNSLHDINAALHGVIYLIFEEQARHFNVITNLFAAAGSIFFALIVTRVFIVSSNISVNELVNVALSHPRVGVTVQK